MSSLSKPCVPHVLVSFDQVMSAERRWFVKNQSIFCQRVVESFPSSCPSETKRLDSKCP